VEEITAAGLQLGQDHRIRIEILTVRVQEAAHLATQDRLILEAAVVVCHVPQEDPLAHQDAEDADKIVSKILIKPI